MSRRSRLEAGARALAGLWIISVAACSGGGGSSGASPSPPPPNQPPELTTTMFSEDENVALNAQLIVNDPDGDPVAVAMQSGLDASLFTFADDTLTLTGVAPFDFEAPVDMGADNIYEVSFTLSDGTDAVTEVVAITIRNIDDTAFETSGAVALVGAAALELGPALAAGDLNGDGYGDAVIGGEVGEALVVLGDFLRQNADTAIDTWGLSLSEGAAFTLTSPTPNSELTPSLTTMSDLDGDGLPEIILANIVFTATDIYILFSSAYPDQGNVDLAAAAASGDAVRIVGLTEGSSAVELPKIATGNFDGDDAADLLICTSGATTANGFQSGAAYIIFGSTILEARDRFETIDLPLSALDKTALILGRGAYFDDCGTGTVPGDVDGDGLDDILIGHSNSSGSFDAQGLRIPRSTGIDASLIFGASLSKANGAAIELADYFNRGQGLRFSVPPLAQFGVSSVGRAGDVNGDGFADVLIAMPTGVSGGDANPAAVYLVFGGPDLEAEAGTSDIALTDIAMKGFGIRVEGLNADFNFGLSLNTLGDVDGDGFSEILIGSEFVSRGPDTSMKSGRTYVVAGSALQFPGVISSSDIGGAVRGVVIEGVDAGDDSGQGISPIGDANGDGVPDLLVSARNADGINEARPNTGEVYVISGALIANAMDAVESIELTELFPDLDAP